MEYCLIMEELGEDIMGESDKLTFGNINALRDLGSSKDYVEGIWMMVQHDTPDDSVLATGVMYSVRQMIKIAFGYRGLI